MAAAAAVGGRCNGERPQRMRLLGGFIAEKVTAVWVCDWCCGPGADVVGASAKPFEPHLIRRGEELNWGLGFGSPAGCPLAVRWPRSGYRKAPRPAEGVLSGHLT
jgi:hypothetical protein